MSKFSIPFNLKIKEPKTSKLYIYIKPTDDYATLKEIFDKLTRRYHYEYEFSQDGGDNWVFKITKLSSMYNTFIHDLVKQTKNSYKIKSITSNDKSNTSQLYIDFILPHHALYGKYKLNKYGDPQYIGETKTAEYIIDKMMTETFKKGVSQHVYRIDKNKYGIGYDVFDLKKMDIYDWRKFYHKLYYLQQMFLDLNIKIKSDNSDHKQLVKCLQDPELLFKGKYSIEFEFPRYNLNINDELNKMMKHVFKRDEYFKDLPETGNYNESRKFILRNNLSEKQSSELKKMMKKIKGGDVKVFVNNKQLSI